jgi:Glycoside-hydrolase family GH114
MRRMAAAAGALGLICAVACSGHAAPIESARLTPSATSNATSIGASTASQSPSQSSSPSASQKATAKATHTQSAAQAPAASPQRPAPRGWWHPTDTGPNNGPEFQWELDHPLNIDSVSDTGSGAVNALGERSGVTTVFDIDGIINPASTVTALHRLNDKAICYIEVGAAGNYYSAADEDVPVTYYQQLQQAGDLGQAEPGYPEFYLNINASSTVRIIEAMIKQQCAAKGFDAVEPDIDDSYTDSTGFGITEQENIQYDRTLGAYAHSLGLAWGQKNGDSDPEFSEALEPTTDFLLDEECNYYQTCGIVTPPYVRAGKLVLNAEYTDDWGQTVATDLGRFCPADVAGHIDGLLFTSALAGQRNPCR